MTYTMYTDYPTNPSNTQRSRNVSRRLCSNVKGM